MALSDACFEFLSAVAEAAKTLAHDAHEYADPDSGLRYGPEIDAIRRASMAASEMPYDPEAACRLIRLAASVMTYHDTVPIAPEAKERRATMAALVRTIQAELDPEEAAAVPAIIDQVTTETPFTRQAADRLRTILAKLSKPAADLAIKIISEVGTATVKRLLNL